MPIIRQSGLSAAQKLWHHLNGIHLKSGGTRLTSTLFTLLSLPTFCIFMQRVILRRRTHHAAWEFHRESDGDERASRSRAQGSETCNHPPACLSALL